LKKSAVLRGAANELAAALAPMARRCASNFHSRWSLFIRAAFSSSRSDLNLPVVLDNMLERIEVCLGRAR
jgi:hypothetical protein